MNIKNIMLLATLSIVSCSHNRISNSDTSYIFDSDNDLTLRIPSSKVEKNNCHNLMLALIKNSEDFFISKPVKKEIIALTIREFTTELLDAPTLSSKMSEAYPENKWLAGLVHASPDHISNASGTVKFPSEYIFGEKHIEFDRNMNAISFLHWAKRGRDDLISEPQPVSNKFSSENLKNFQELLNKVLVTNEDWDAMLAYMAIHDLGKVDAFKKYLKKSLNVDYVDHDKLLLEALVKRPELFPSFKRLSKKYQNMIINGIRADFNMGQFLQGENLAGNLNGLKNLDKESLNFYLVHIVADIAGAAGHVRPNGSVIMTKSTYEGFQHGIEALNGLGMGKSILDVYDDFLNIRGSKLGLSPDNELSKAAIKLSLMLRISDPAQAEKVLKIISELPQKTKNFFLKEINKNGVNDGVGFLLYYSPATVSNLIKSMEFEAGIKLGIEMLTKAYSLARSAYTSQESSVKTVLISDMAELAKNPRRLQSSRMKLEKKEDDSVIYFEHHLDDIIKIQQDAGYRVEGQNIASLYSDNFSKFRNQEGKFQVTLKVNDRTSEALEVQEIGSGVKNRVVKMSDGSIYKIPKTPENAVTLEIEKIINEDLKRNFWKYGITVDNILEEGPNGSWLKKEFFNSEMTAEKLIKNGNLSEIQLRELKKSWEGARKYAKETGVALDFTADNLYWNGKTWVLFDCGPRTSSGNNKYKYTLNSKTFEDYLKIWNRGYFD